jgi:hypothetical protein
MRLAQKHVTQGISYWNYADRHAIDWRIIFDIGWALVQRSSPKPPSQGYWQSAFERLTVLFGAR